MRDVLILSGFAGSGKGTVCAIARQKEPRLRLSVSMTTRSPRPGEVNGREYTFVTPEEFRRTIEEDGFLEYAQYSANSYGTPKGQFDELIAQGFIPVLEIETRGAEQAMGKLDNYLSVFLTPPGFRKLEERLRGRKTETEDSIRRRLAEAREELKRVERYQYLILNQDGQAEEAADAILDLLRTGRTDSPALIRDKASFIASFYDDDPTNSGKTEQLKDQEEVTK